MITWKNCLEINGRNLYKDIKKLSLYIFFDYSKKNELINILL